MGHVYLLKADRKWHGKHLVKIGMTDKPDVRDRVRQIKKDWEDQRSIQVKYLDSFKAWNATQSETKLHRQFNRFSVFGKNIQKEWGGDCTGDTEWFAVNDSELRSIAKCYGSSYNLNSGENMPWGAIALISVLIGWMLSPHLKTQAVKAPTTAAKTAIVTSPVNVRSAPSQSAAKLGTLPQGRSVKVLEVKDGWFRIGDQEWIAGNFAREKR
jgi:hypothetical protein